jgi:leader peptidase (prepilin peptidase)/N-methyltransferase
MIPFYDNIPILSYLLLRGKCRNCHVTHRHSLPLGGTVGRADLRPGLRPRHSAPTLHGLVVFAFIATLTVVTFIDLDHRIIPDTISLPGIPIFFLWPPWPCPASPGSARAIGIVAGGGSLLRGCLGLPVDHRKRGHGWRRYQAARHDWRHGRLAGRSVHPVCRVGHRHHRWPSWPWSDPGKGMRLAIPFGPFLATGAVVYLFFGQGLDFLVLQYACVAKIVPLEKRPRLRFRSRPQR